MSAVNDPWVLKIIGGVQGMERFPEMLAHVGRYLVRYEPEWARTGDQWLWTTDSLDEARAFDTAEELHDLYQTSIGTRPWDGQPDRPLTAYHVEVALKSAFEEGPGRPVREEGGPNGHAR